MRGARLGALAVALGVASSFGCVASLYHLWPQSTVTDEVVVVERVEVRAVPEGGLVTTEDGEEIGAAPVQREMTYRVKRSWRKRSLAPVYVGGLIVLVSAAYLISQFEGDLVLGFLPWPESHLQKAAGVVTFWDALSTPMLLQHGLSGNRRNETFPLREPVPASERMVVRWPGWEPIAVEVEVPRHSGITVRRPQRGTFDEAVLYWARTSGREPDAEGSFHIAEAYRRLAARTGDRGDAEAAIRYYEQVLAGPEAAAEHRDAAARHLELLRAEEHP